jgi:hypothetical protein
MIKFILATLQRCRDEREKIIREEDFEKPSSANRTEPSKIHITIKIDFISFFFRTILCEKWHRISTVNIYHFCSNFTNTLFCIEFIRKQNLIHRVHFLMVLIKQLV